MSGKTCSWFTVYDGFYAHLSWAKSPPGTRYGHTKGSHSLSGWSRIEDMAFIPTDTHEEADLDTKMPYVAAFDKCSDGH